MKRAIAILCVVAVATVVGASATAAPHRSAGITNLSVLTGNSYGVNRLVSDQAGQAKSTDPNLVNAWGLASGPNTPWWVNAADSVQVA